MLWWPWRFMMTRMYMYIFIRDVTKNMKPLWKVKGSLNRTSWKVSDVQIVRYIWVLCLSLCLCLCLCVLFVVVMVSVWVETCRDPRFLLWGRGTNVELTLHGLSERQECCCLFCFGSCLRAWIASTWRGPRTVAKCSWECFWFMLRWAFAGSSSNLRRKRTRQQVFRKVWLLDFEGFEGPTSSQSSDLRNPIPERELRQLFRIAS